MNSYNNWITSNISQRLTNPLAKLKLEMKVPHFARGDFHECALEAAQLIAKQYDNIYIALSGGMDSEYVVRTFVKNHIKFTPILLKCGNELERVYAYKLCAELNLSPIILHLSEDDMVDKFYESIHKKLNGVGYHATLVVAIAEYVQSKNGILITSDGFFGDGDDMITDGEFSLYNEWDDYISVLVPTVPNISFFLHTPQLTYSMLPVTYTAWNVFKADLYGIECRPKMRPIYKDSTIKKLHNINANVIRAYNICSIVYTKQEILEIFNTEKVQLL